MANVIFYYVDVLASSPDEINRIEARLKQPSAELVKWVAKEFEASEDAIAVSLPGIIGFETVEDLSRPDEEGNESKAGRRFKTRFKRGGEIIVNHLFEVSHEYPAAIFLLEHLDDMANYFGKVVIRGGKVIREVLDEKMRAQGRTWVFLDIFAPFESEWQQRLEFGSLWEEWVDELVVAAEKLQKAPESRKGDQNATGHDARSTAASEASVVGEPS